MLRSRTIRLVTGSLARIAVGIELPRIAWAVGAPNSERRCSHNHHHRRHNQGYRKNHKYALHSTSPPFLLHREDGFALHLEHGGDTGKADQPFGWKAD